MEQTIVKHIIESKTSTVGVEVFIYKVSRSMPVYVPDASVNAYQADTLWGQLNIVGASHEGTSLTNTNSTTTSIRKIIENGQHYILLPDGIRYEVTGKKIE